MKSFNLRKKAESDLRISDKKLENQRKDFNLSNEQQGVVEKNINLSIGKKDKDNTIPFEVQLESSRKNNKDVKITEGSMDKKEILFNEKHDYVSKVNRESQKYDDAKKEAFQKASTKDKNTSFWDKFVGVQLEQDGMPTKINNNIPSKASQIENNPDRFKNEESRKMVSSSMKDADAMLFHIFATAKKENRDLNSEEKQQVIDIESAKIEMIHPFRR